MNPLAVINRIRLTTEAEFARAVRGRFIYFAIVFVAVVVLLSGYAGSAGSPADGDPKPTDRELHENGYFLFTTTFSRGVFVATLFVLVFGALSLSVEGGQGLFRMILIRPFRRWEYFAGKVILVAFFGLFLLWLTFIICYIQGGLYFGYGDIIDPEYSDYVFTSRADMTRALWKVVFSQIPVMLAAGGLALLASAVTDSPGLAVGAAIGAYLAGSVVSMLSETAGRYVFTTYSGFLIRGSLDDAGNPIAVFSRMAESFTDYRINHEIIDPTWYIGAGSFLVLIVVAGVVFSRRDVLR